MSEQPIFKKAALGGFDKKSVLNYIFELNNTAKEAQEKLSAQLEEVKASREQLGEQLKGLESKLQASQEERESLSGELQAEKARTGQLDELIESMKAEQQRQQEIILQKDEEIARFQMENDKLRARNQELEEKREEVERASVYIGELMLRTRTESEQMLANAQSQSAQALREAEEQGRQTVAGADRQAQEIVSQALRQAGETLDSAKIRAAQITENADRSLEGARAQFRQFQQQMAELQSQFMTSFAAMEERFSIITDTVAGAEASLGSISVEGDVEEELPGQWEDVGGNVTFFRPAAEN